MTEQRFFIETFPTPTGSMRLLTDDQGSVRALDWDDHDARLHRLLRLHYGAGRTRLEAVPRASNARCAVEAYFAGELSAIDGLEVKTGGTAFQREVWAALRAIPAGETTSYGRLAARLGCPKAVRAVGLANGANPVGIVVPCHRVIGANTALTGYGGGLERKRWLLEHEGAAPFAELLASRSTPHLRNPLAPGKSVEQAWRARASGGEQIGQVSPD